jgi:hypothetical protein
LVLLHSAASSYAFVGFPPLTSRRTTLQTTVFSTKPFGKKGDHKNADDIAELRADVERMREEASMRLEALNEKLITASQKIDDDSLAHQPDHGEHNPPILASLAAPTSSITARAESVNVDDAKSMDNLVDIADTFEKDMHILNQKKELKANMSEKPATRHPLKLLDDTRWRLVLSVHRVRGTWMPKTWGASGDHLRLKLEVEFTAEELYEREDFFNGLSDGSKVLRIVNSEASLAPTMSEAEKKVRIVDGGWRVCPNEGPLGTAILRWYFDVEEETSHLGSDIYLPAGRVYGTCGYFPMIGRSNVDGRGTSKREVYKQEIRQMEVKYLSLQSEMEADTDLVSIDKFKRWHEMQDIRKEAKKIKRTIDEELIREPTKDSLRMSRDQSVGLTHEGGICCKKQNGLAQEYHILGKFEVASIENREHSDYRDLLRP